MRLDDPVVELECEREVPAHHRRAVREVVEVHDGVPAVRKYLPLALEFDNRIVETHEAGAFLAAIKRNIEEPGRYCA